jgi:hypothetical protein
MEYHSIDYVPDFDLEGQVRSNERPFSSIQLSKQQTPPAGANVIAFFTSR